ncbi:MAG: hypothetical protein V3U97_03280, partial [bacterium]
RNYPYAADVMDNAKDLLLVLGPDDYVNAYMRILRKHFDEEFIHFDDNELGGKTIRIALGENPWADIADIMKVKGRLNNYLAKGNLKKRLEIVNSIATWTKSEDYKVIEEISKLSAVKLQGIPQTSGIPTDLLIALTLIESRFEQYILVNGTIRVNISKARAIGTTQLRKIAVRQIARLIVGKKGEGGYMLMRERMEHLRREAEDYLKEYREASSDEGKDEAVKEIVEKIDRQVIGVNLYFALAVWELYHQSKEPPKIDESEREDILNRVKKLKIKIESEESTFKVSSYQAGRLRIERDWYEFYVFFKVLEKISEPDFNRGIISEPHIIPVAMQQKPKKREEFLYRYLWSKAKEDETDNQRIGYLYFFYLWDRYRRLALTKDEKKGKYSFTEKRAAYLEKYPGERGFDNGIAAPAAFNRGIEPVNRAILAAVKEVQGRVRAETLSWVKRGRLADETRAYIRKALEVIHHRLTAKLSPERDRVLRGLLERKYDAIREQFSKFDSELAYLLAYTLGSEFVDDYWKAYKQKWEFKILIPDNLKHLAQVIVDRNMKDISVKLLTHLAKKPYRYTEPQEDITTQKRPVAELLSKYIVDGTKILKERLRKSQEEGAKLEIAIALKEEKIAREQRLRKEIQKSFEKGKPIYEASKIFVKYGGIVIVGGGLGILVWSLIKRKIRIAKKTQTLKRSESQSVRRQLPYNKKRGKSSSPAIS